MFYWLTILRTESFRKKPFGTLGRAVQWLTCHVWPEKYARISLPVGQTEFILDLPPRARRYGSTGIFVQRSFYEPLLQYCDRFIGEGDVVFDCGASQGIYSCAFAALAGPTGRVVAIEPQAYAVAALRHNLSINGFENVWVEEAAASDREGTATLDSSGGGVAASIVRDLGGTQTASVRTITLAGLAERLKLARLDLIKFDVAGAEYLSLLGAGDLLTQFSPCLIIEDSSRDPNWSRVPEYLIKRGYHAYIFGQDGEIQPINDADQDHPDLVIFLKASSIHDERDRCIATLDRHGRPSGFLRFARCRFLPSASTLGLDHRAWLKNRMAAKTQSPNSTTQLTFSCDCP